MGLGAWALAADAALEGQLRAVSTRPEDARPWLLLAALLGYAGVRLIEQDLSKPEPEAESVKTIRQPLIVAALLGLGGLASIFATIWLVAGLSEPTPTWVWLGALLAVLAGATVASGPRLHVPRPAWRPTRNQLLEIGALLIIFGVAVWLRLPNLAELPPNLHGDEVSIGLDARQILAGQMAPVFATGWYDVPALSFDLHAAAMLVFGNDLFGLRMGSVIEGLFSLLLLFLLARRLWGPRPALVATAFMAVAAWHIHFSRTGFHYMQAPLVGLAALYFAVRGIQDRRLLDWILCGFVVGLSIEVYYAARLAPVIVVAYLAYRAVTERSFVRTHAVGLVALAVGAFVFVAPMLAVFARSPISFNARTSGVLITTPSNLEHELGGYHVSSLQEVLAIQVQHTLEAFNIHGETSLQYGHTDPLLDFWTGALLATSAVAILLRPGSSRGFLLAVWVWLTLLAGSVMTVDALFSPRVLLALPALVLGPALVLERVWGGVTRLGGRIGAYGFAVPVIAVLGLALQANVHHYFDVQVVERQPAGPFSLLAKYAQTVQDSYRLYVIGRDDWSLTSEAPRFVVPRADAVNVRSTPLAIPLERIPTDKGVAFLVENSASDFNARMAAIRGSYPNGREEVIFERPGNAAFTSYLVDHAALVAANPGAQRD